MKDRKSQREVFCKKSVLQKAFLKFVSVLCICGQNPLKLPVKEVNFSNVSGIQHATLLKKCTLSQEFFKDFDPTGREQLFCTTCPTSMATSGKIYILLLMWTSTVLTFT